MYKFIVLAMVLVFAQCKSNEIVDEAEKEMITASSTDTIIKEEKYLYRGDTLISYITIVGDTIINKVTTKYNSVGEGEGEAVMMADSRVRRMESMSDGMVMTKAESAPPRTAEPMPGSKGGVRPEIPQDPQAGQLTAGEWNDLNNWENWKSLLENNNYSQMQGEWGIFPTERYSVFVRNDKNLPLADLRVDLLSAGKVIWTARTDNSGKAELWSNFESKNSNKKSNLSVKVYHERNVYDLMPTKDQSINLVIENACNTTSNVDIMFVVDATGSMGDEITYLKSEVKDVIDRSAKNGKDLNLRIGSVFYRDSRDSYLTKTSPLSASHDRVYEFIDNQSAGGGGDFPEAVDAALEEALAQQWSETAIARIVFLILDAPPHSDEQIKSTIRDQIKEASERGIKLIPISSSGINRETEFLLKFMSIATNGTYVFITDDSGIGNPHLDPLVDDYEVEMLNDLMTRLVSHYTELPSCNTEIVENKKVKIYPNPTSNYINIDTDIALTDIKIVSNSGMVVLRSKPQKGSTRIDLSGLVDGMYTVQCIGSDTQYSYPIIVVRE